MRGRERDIHATRDDPVDVFMARQESVRRLYQTTLSTGLSLVVRHPVRKGGERERAIYATRDNRADGDMARKDCV